MNFKVVLLMTFAVVASMLFAGCSSDDPIKPEITAVNGSIDYFKESMDFDAAGGSKVINFTSNVDWTLKISQTQNSVNWCTVSRSEGNAGTFNITVTVAENSNYDDRNVVLILSAGEITKNIIINQKQKKAITLTTDRFEVGAKGEIIEIEVKSNVDYSVQISEDSKSWISQVSTRALSTKTLSFEIAENNEYSKREGKIILSSNEVTEAVKVYQSGSAILILSQNEYTIGSEGGSISVEISSNFEFEVDMPNVDWIKSASQTRAQSSHTLSYIISPNSTYDDREAVIVFKDANNEKKESVTVKQRQKDAVLLSNRKVELPQEGGTFSVDINSNVDYSVEIPKSYNSWLSEIQSNENATRTLSVSTLSFKAANSDLYDKREGEIYFKYKDLADTLKVYQSGGAILVLSQTDYNLGGGASTISIELKSNISYVVTTSADWITEVSTRAVSSSTKKFDISANRTGQSRSGRITFTTSDGSKSATVNITQDTVTEVESSFQVGPAGGTIDVEVKPNVEYSVVIPDDCKTWISQASARELSSKNITFNISKNNEYSKREGKIILSSNEVTETVKVYQAGSAILILSQNEYTIGSDGGSISVEISSNFEYEVDMPNVDWIKSASQTRAISTHKLIYTISPNLSYNDREAVIVFKDTNSDKKESVTIKQRQKDAILLSNKKVEISQEGGSFSIDVNSNVDYSIIIPNSCSSWVSRTNQSTTRALSTSTVGFKVASSDLYDKREGEIYFKYKDVVDTLKVYQSGGAVLVLSQSNYTLEGKATTISVSLKSNIDYAVSTSVDWITEVSTRAVSNSTKKFDISANNTGKSRTGVITFTTSDGSKSASVTVTQAAVLVAKSLNINFSNTSGTIGGLLYIGKNYNLSVTASPSNALTNYEWKIENGSIASISGNGSNATLTTKDFGHTKVIVTEKNSGLSASYEFGTAVTDFQFTENTGETELGLPKITMVLGEKRQINYSCSPNYATKVFSELRGFNFKELSGNTFYIVNKSTIVDIDENGVMTAKKVGCTIIDLNNGYGICKKGPNDGIYVEVVSKSSGGDNETIYESEYNDDFERANVINVGQKMVFQLRTTNDVDVFKFTRPSTNFDVKLTYKGDMSSGGSSSTRILSYSLYNSSYSEFSAKNPHFTSSGGENTISEKLNTTQGYIRFYIKDQNKQYFTPTGEFVLELIAK